MDVMMGAGAPLDCNHGEQKGGICVCDSGWGSSGIDSNIQEHWCDVLDSSNMQISTGPVELSYIQELTAIIVSSSTLCSITMMLQVPNKLVCVYVLVCHKALTDRLTGPLCGESATASGLGHTGRLPLLSTQVLRQVQYHRTKENNIVTY